MGDKVNTATEKESAEFKRKRNQDNRRASRANTLDWRKNATKTDKDTMLSSLAGRDNLSLREAGTRDFCTRRTNSD